MKPVKLQRSQKQEKRVAAELGGKTQKASGAGWDNRNDVKTHKFLIECKRTDNEKSISLKLVDLRDLQQHALIEGLLPMMDAEIKDEGFFVLPRWVLYEILPDGWAQKSV